MEELKKVVAFVFRMKGQKTLKESVFRETVSFNLRWFSPEEALLVVSAAVDANVLHRKDGELTPNFDIHEINLPLTYRPPIDVLPEHPPDETRQKASGDADDIFLKILKRIEKDSGLPRKQLMSRINAVQREMGIDIEVAALIIASDLGVDPAEYSKKVEERIIAKYDTG